MGSVLSIVLWAIANAPQIIADIGDLINLIHTIHPNQAKNVKADLLSAGTNAGAIQATAAKWKANLAPSPAVAQAPDLVGD